MKWPRYSAKIVAMAPSAEARMTVSSDQPKRKAGSGSERLEDVGEDPARSGQGAGQLGRVRAPKSAISAADDPGQEHRARILEPLGDGGGNPEDAAPDGGADKHRHRTPEPKVAGKPLTPGVAFWKHRPNISLTRSVEGPFFAAR